jgi:signal transduction histidine kinase
VLLWRGNVVRAYADVEGGRRELEGDLDGRAVTSIERDGCPLAAIVHDVARLDEPDLVEHVATVVGLEVERDRSLFELEQSERRSRALLDAVPDKMFRIRRDGIILDIQENGEHVGAPTPAGVAVGASVYDAAVPRDVTERVMAAGRLALDRGELQTIEWELGEVGNMRHLEGRFLPSGEDEFLAVVRDVTKRKRHEVEQAALHRVALAVASEGRPERIFDMVAEEAGRVLEAHSAVLLRYEQGGDSVIVGRWSEPGAYFRPLGHRFPLQAGTAAHRVYTTRRPVRIDLDGLTDTAFADYMRQIGANSIVAAPITVTGRLWGLTAARLSPPHVFPSRAEERLDRFARLVSLALANEEARDQLAASRARLVSTADEERRRLERNLHDGAQQRLVAVSLELRRAQTKVASDPVAANALLAAATEEMGVALEELRELARGIHPAVLTARGLGPALQSLAERSAVPVRIDLDATRSLPAHIEVAVYYLVAESLTNVAKYAEASAVAVRVGRENGSVFVEVVDDGIGGAEPGRGSGLRGLIDRIEALGGTLELQSRPGDGTTIAARIPSS